MKKILEKVFVVLAALLFLVAIFYIFCFIKSYVAEYSNTLSIIIFFAYLILVFIFVNLFNKKLNKIDYKIYLGRSNLNSILKTFAISIFIWILPFFFLYDYNYIILSANEIINNIIGNIFVVIHEELIHRAFVFLSFMIIFRKVLVSAILSSLIFTLLHLNFASIEFLNIFLGGLICSYLYVKYNSILSPMIFHFTFNVLNSSFSLEGIQNQTFTNTQTSILLLFFIYLFFNNIKTGKDLVTIKKI